MVAGDGEHQTGAHRQGGGDMATGETGFDDLSVDLISLQYHSLKAGHDYGRYVRDAKNLGVADVESFFNEVMAQDPNAHADATSFRANCRGRLRPDPSRDKNCDGPRRAGQEIPSCVVATLPPAAKGRVTQGRAAVYAVNRRDDQV